MANQGNELLVETLLDSWDRNNTILVNLLRDAHYDHPVLMLQHLIWHEGYHHGQIKLVLKMAGRSITNKQAGPLTWGIWMNKTSKGTMSE
jgi:uncharacterized damage-inducible protein DinB